jgi:predicted small lipoprotein YifL
MTLVALSACGEAGPVNPPTEPARPIEAVDPGAPADDGTVSMMPGRGPTSFVGRWAADPVWCATPQGAERPIEITATRFEGYENSCSIAAVDELVDGYVATLACQAEGQMSSERVRFQVTGDVMRLTWLDRGVESVTLRKCTTLEDTAAPAVGGP